MKGKDGDGRKFALAISSYDCAGCGSCVESCPAKNKALEMVSFESSESQEEQKVFDYLEKHVGQEIGATEAKSVKEVASGSRIWNSRVRARDAVSRLMQSW